MRFFRIKVASLNVSLNPFFRVPTKNCQLLIYPRMATGMLHEALMKQHMTTFKTICKLSLKPSAEMTTNLA